MGEPYVQIVIEKQTIMGVGKSDTSQELRVLEALQKAKGEWVSKRYFVQTMYLSQAGRALFNLQKYPDYYGYEGTIESSAKYKLRDEYNFVYWRLKVEEQPKIEPRVSNGFIRIQGEIGEKKVEVARLF